MSDIIAIGGCNLDIKAKLSCAEITASSNPGHVSFTPGGVARNISQNLAHLGLSVSLISTIGTDAAAALLLAATTAAGVDLTHLKPTSAPTSSYVALLNEHGEMISAVNDMLALDELDIAWLQQRQQLLAQASFILADCNIALPLLIWLVQNFGEKLIIEPVSVAKSVKLKACLQAGSILLATPNASQLLALTGEPDLEAACSSLQAQGCRNLVVHRGADGAFVKTAASSLALKAHHQPQVSDVTGAGDAAVAGLVYGLCRGYDLFHSAELGQRAASLMLASLVSAGGALRPGILEEMP